MSERQNSGKRLSREARSAVNDYKTEISKADGSVIQLKKPTSDGRQLYIAARHIGNPLEPNTPNTEHAKPDFYLWEDVSNGWNIATGVMLVDVYAENEAGIEPLGHMDWWLQYKYANGGGNMHDAAIPTTDAEKLSRKRWHQNDFTAFKVDADYHGQGIGSLMIATTAVVLPAIGMNRFYTGVLLEPAKRAYDRFEIKEDEFPTTGVISYRTLPISRLSKHPQVNRVIAAFV